MIWSRNAEWNLSWEAQKSNKKWSDKWMKIKNSSKFLRLWASESSTADRALEGNDVILFISITVYGPPLFHVKRKVCKENNYKSSEVKESKSKTYVKMIKQSAVLCNPEKGCGDRWMKLVHCTPGNKIHSLQFSRDPGTDRAEVKAGRRTWVKSFHSQLGHNLTLQNSNFS